jgi:LuxR family maltose regulon positive regulatory protein
LYALAALNTRAKLALHEGETAQVREFVAQQAPYGNAGTLRLASALGRMLAAMSHLWDGDPIRAEASLLPALLHAERDGRRNVIASLLASIVATAVYQRGDAAHAQALLANRLDVIERVGFPDNLLLAYRTLAFAALEQGDERGAMAALQQLDALAVRRALPRVRAVALSEQIRLHAAHASRRETVARLLRTLEGLAPNFETDDVGPLRNEYCLATAIARAHAAIGEDRMDAAELHLAEADTIAESIHRGYDVLRIRMLRGIVGTQRGHVGADALLREAQELTSLTGHARLHTDSHPHAEKLIARARTPARRAVMPGHLRSPMLTSKESEVLHLLGRGLPNKGIARALDVSGETVKFHLKNLFVKLSASSRSHALERARMLGLVS